MKSVILVASMLFSVWAHADDTICALSQVVDGRPEFWENKVVRKNVINELATTNGLFKGRAIYQENLGGWALSIKFGDTSVAGFFDGSPKYPVLSMIVDGTKAQLICKFN
jgi:hypothetical protein